MSRALVEARDRVRCLEAELAALYRSIAAEPGPAQRELAAARLRLGRACLLSAAGPSADWGLVHDGRFVGALEAVNVLISEREGEAGEAGQLVLFDGGAGLAREVAR